MLCRWSETQIEIFIIRQETLYDDKRVTNNDLESLLKRHKSTTLTIVPTTFYLLLIVTSFSF